VSTPGRTDLADAVALCSSGWARAAERVLRFVGSASVTGSAAVLVSAAGSVDLSTDGTGRRSSEASSCAGGDGGLSSIGPDWTSGSDSFGTAIGIVSSSALVAAAGAFWGPMSDDGSTED